MAVIKRREPQAHFPLYPMNSGSCNHSHHEVTFLEGDFISSMPILCIPGIKAGFPSPAADYEQSSLDFNHDLIQHPGSTFYAIVRGDSMSGVGIDDGDIIVVDREQSPENGDVIVALLNGEFTVKAFNQSHKDEGYIELLPANPQYSKIRIEKSDEFSIWGVVIWTIRQRRNIRLL